MWSCCPDEFNWPTSIYLENHQTFWTWQHATSLNSNGHQFKAPKIGKSGDWSVPVSINAGIPHVCGYQNMSQYYVCCPFPFSALNCSGTRTSQHDQKHVSLPNWDTRTWINLFQKSIQMWLSQFFGLRTGLVIWIPRDPFPDTCSYSAGLWLCGQQRSSPHLPYQVLKLSTWQWLILGKNWYS